MAKNERILKPITMLIFALLLSASAVSLPPAHADGGVDEQWERAVRFCHSPPTIAPPVPAHVVDECIMVQAVMFGKNSIALDYLNSGKIGLNQLLPFVPFNELSLTPLMIAAATGNETLLDELIRRGAGVDFANSQGQTALYWASRSVLPRTIRKLLARGADPQKRTATHESMLFAAASGLAGPSYARNRVSGDYPSAGELIEVLELYFGLGMDATEAETQYGGNALIALVNGENTVAATLEALKKFAAKWKPALEARTPLGTALLETVHMPKTFGCAPTDSSCGNAIAFALLDLGANPTAELDQDLGRGENILHEAAWNAAELDQSTRQAGYLMLQGLLRRLDEPTRLKLLNSAGSAGTVIHFVESMYDATEPQVQRTIGLLKRYGGEE